MAMARNTSKPSPESELLAAVQMLTDEVAVLRNAVDELRVEVQWGNQNHGTESHWLTGRRIQSCSLDPTSPDFAVNTVDQDTIEKLRAEVTPPPRGSHKQGQLFT
jgi:hypothetical protein